MNSQEAVERAIRLITPAPTAQELTYWRTTLNVLIKDAQTELADQVASGDRARRELLRKTFASVASDSGGIADLTTLVTHAEPLMLKHFNLSAIYLDGVARRVTLLPDETAVKWDRPAGFPFGALIGTSLLVYNDGQPFQGNVSITGQYIASLANLNTELHDPFVMTLYALGTRQIPSPQRTTVREMKAVATESK